MGDPQWSSLFLKDCTLWKGTHIGAVHEKLQPVGGTFTLEQGQSVRSPPPEEEGAAETTHDELTTTPIPHLPVPLRRRKQRKSGVKLNPERKEGLGEGVFKAFWFYFSLPYSDLIGNKLISPSEVYFACDSNWQVTSLSLSPNTQAFHHIFLPLSS